MALSSRRRVVNERPNQTLWEERKMTEKTLRRQSVSRRTLLSGTAGLVGGAALSSSTALAQSAAPASPAATANSPPSPSYPNPTWLAQRKEEILEPGLEIVDPHHHL